MNKIWSQVNRFWLISYPSVIIIVGSIAYSVYVFLNLKDGEQTNLNYLTISSTAISIIGSFASIIGLIIAFFQIFEIRKTTEETKLLVEESLRKMKEVLMVSELSKAVQILREIQKYLADDKIQFAQMRMKDIKPVLIQVKYNPDLQRLVIDNSYDSLIQDFGLNLETINAHIAGRKKGFNIGKVDKNMEDLATTLIYFEKEIISNHGKA